MNGKPDTYGKVVDDTLPIILGDQKFKEFSEEVKRLLTDLSHTDTIWVTSEVPPRAVAGHLLAAAGLIKRVGRPIDEVYAITNKGREALDRITNS